MHNESRPEVPTWVSPAIACLLRSCWAADPAQRPSMETVRFPIRLDAITFLILNCSASRYQHRRAGVPVQRLRPRYETKIPGGGCGCRPQVIEVLRTTQDWDTDGRLAKQATLARDWAKETGLLRHSVVTKSNVIVDPIQWPIVSSSVSSLPIHPSAAARGIPTKRPKGGRTASAA